MCVGSEFQVDGAETEKAREVKLLVIVLVIVLERYVTALAASRS